MINSALKKLLFAFMCLAVSAVLAKPPELHKRIIVKTESWPGLAEKNGSGYFLELIKTIYQPLGYELVIKFCPWKRCVFDVLSESGDIVIGVYANEQGLAKSLLIPRYPISIEKVFIAFKRDNWPDFQGPISYKNERVVQLLGYELDKELPVPIKLEEVATPDQAWHMLMADRVDFYLAGYRQILWPMQATGSNLQEYRLEPVFEQRSYLGFSDNQKGLQLIKDFEQQLAKLYQSGAIWQLQKKWSLPWPIPLE